MERYTQCPAYQPTIDYFKDVTRRIIGDWGFEGLKLDGQHLNSVAPCYNKAHNHARPEESVEKLGLLDGHLQGGNREQSGGRRRALPVRHRVQLPQHSGDEQHPASDP